MVPKQLLQVCTSSSSSAEPWEQEAGDGKSEPPPAHPCLSCRPPESGRIFLCESFHLAAHPSPVPAEPYMGKAGEAEPLAGGNPEFPKVTGWILVQTFTQNSHEVGKRNLGSLYPLGARNVYLFSKQTLKCFYS